MFQDEKLISPQILLIALSLLATLWVQAPRFVDPYGVDEDFRSFYWMNKFQETGLFPNDQLRGYKYVNLRLPWGDLPLYFYSLGYDLLFYVASFFVSPMVFSKLLAFLLMPLAVWCLFQYGASIRHRSAGIVLATGFLFLNLASPTSLSVVSGFQRAFACPLLIALLYSLHHRKSVMSASIILASALIYPPVFLIGTATWGLFSLSLILGSRTSWKAARQEFLTLLAVFLLGALLLSPVLVPRLAGALSPQATSSQADQTIDRQDQIQDPPYYQPGGRNPLFYVFPFVGRGGLVNKSLTGSYLLILTFIGALILLIRPSWDSLSPPREVWCMLLASLTLFVTAWIAFLLTDSFLLYLPSRYTRVGLFLFLSMFVFLNIGDAIKEAVHLIRRHPRAMVWLIGGIEVMVFGFILLYPSGHTRFAGINMKWLLAPASLLLGILAILSVGNTATTSIPTRPGQNTLGRVLIGIALVASAVGWGSYARMVSGSTVLDPSPAEQELLAFLETLPKDVLLAGSPCALDSVTLFAKRQILFSCETISQDAVLMLEALNAYYAEESQAVLEFCEVHEVDYLVIDHQTYTQEYLEAGWIFFEPHNQELLPRIRARDTFALAHVPDKAKVFEAGDFFVVPCTRSALGD